MDHPFPSPLPPQRKLQFEAAISARGSVFSNCPFPLNLSGIPDGGLSGEFFGSSSDKTVRPFLRRTDFYFSFPFSPTLAGFFWWGLFLGLLTSLKHDEAVHPPSPVHRLIFPRIPRPSPFFASRNISPTLLSDSRPPEFLGNADVPFPR